MSDIYINHPSSFKWRLTRTCTRCKAPTDHLVQSFVWYGPIVICCQCGAYRNDGKLRRRRKKDAVVAAKARRGWETAGSIGDFHSWLDAQIEAHRAVSS